MICPNCKQEIEDGSIYCEHCGQTIQIVPDYNALDDVLPSILEENPTPAPKVGNQKTKEHSAKKTAHPKTGQQRLVIGVCCGVLVVIIGIFAWQSYLHSYTYFMNRGEALEAEKEYADAKKYYDRAYKKNDTVEALLIGVLPEYQAKGAALLMFKYLHENYLRLGIKHMLLNPQLEDNHKVQNLFGEYNPQPYQRRRSFVKEI